MTHISRLKKHSSNFPPSLLDGTVIQAEFQDLLALKDPVILSSQPVVSDNSATNANANFPTEVPKLDFKLPGPGDNMTNPPGLVTKLDFKLPGHGDSPIAVPSDVTQLDFTLLGADVGTAPANDAVLKENILDLAISPTELKRRERKEKARKLKLERVAQSLPSARSRRRHLLKDQKVFDSHENLAPVVDPIETLSPHLQKIFRSMGGIPVSIRTLSDVDRPFSLNDPIDPYWRISHIIDYGIFGERRNSAEFFLVSFVGQPEASNRWLLMDQVRKLPGFTEDVDRVWFNHFSHIQGVLRKKHFN